MSLIPRLSISTRRKAWSMFCATGNIEQLDHLPAHVVSSWQRSRKCGVDPGLREIPYESVPEIYTNPRKQLVDATKLVLNCLAHEIEASSILILLTDQTGTIIHRGGNRAMLRLADTINVVPGAVAAEHIGGTNGCGSALVLRDVMPLDLYEHYCEGFFEWSDVGVPLIHPTTNELLGVIDLVRWKQPLTPELALLSKAAARNIQSALHECERRAHRALLEEFSRRTSRQLEPALAVDGNGLIVTANDACARWLHTKVEQLQGRAICDFRQFGADLSMALERLNQDTEASEIVLESSGNKALLNPVQLAGEFGGVFITLPQSTVSRQARPIRRWKSRYIFDDIVGEDPGFQAVLEQAKKAAATDLQILLCGETGSGKELVAHAIHSASPRASGPFVTVNCGAIPEELIASELFGYEKGSFTGASTTGKLGRFALANGGTIFLDEVTETSFAFQVALLRVLQDGEIIPLGAEHPVPVDVRVIAATNRDIDDLLEQQKFRSDLYYRLATVSLALPALRERPGDIEPLVNHFLQNDNRNMKPDKMVISALQQYRWPGNVRELAMVLESSAVMATNETIVLTDLPKRVTQAFFSPDLVKTKSVDCSDNLLEREYDPLCLAIETYHGNVKQIASALGLARSSLYRRVKKFGLEERLLRARQAR